MIPQAIASLLFGTLVAARPKPGSAITAAVTPAVTATANVPAITTRPLVNRRQATTEVSPGCSLSSYESLVNTFTYSQITSTRYETIPAGHICICDGGDVPFGQGKGNNGQTTWYCRPDGSYTSLNPDDAQSTEVPAPTPGSADNAGWAQVQCDDGSLTGKRTKW